MTQKIKKGRVKGVSNVAGVVNPGQIDWFKDYPDYAIRMVEDKIAEVVASRMLYPFAVANLVRNQDGSYTAW